MDDLNGTRPPADELRLVGGFCAHPAAIICALTGHWVAATVFGFVGALLVVGPFLRIARYYSSIRQIDG